jgi:hypothetical protein
MDQFCHHNLGSPTSGIAGVDPSDDRRCVVPSRPRQSTRFGDPAGVRRLKACTIAIRDWMMVTRLDVLDSAIAPIAEVDEVASDGGEEMDLGGGSGGEDRPMTGRLRRAS